MRLHKDCAYYKNGICTLFDIVVNGTDSACGNFKE